jgi:AmiR/NasT family two-component response regulator
MNSPPRLLRVFCIEDNALLVMHLQMVIEEAGHVFAGSASCFGDVKAQFDQVPFDLALVDIDLIDGSTGGDIAEWLQERGRPSVFITGQEQIAQAYAHASLGMIIKPISEESVRTMLASVAAQIGA